MEANKSHKNLFKLEDTLKKEIFSVPDGYFNTLPSIIQAKAIESTKKKTVFAHVGVLRLAIPSLLLIMIAGYFGYKYQYSTQYQDAKIESMLAQVSTTEMVNYLDQTDLTSDELLDLVSFEGEKIDDVPINFDDVSDEELELLINEFEIEDINKI